MRKHSEVIKFWAIVIIPLALILCVCGPIMYATAGDITHNFVSAKPASADATQVDGPKWNAAHVVNMAYAEMYLAEGAILNGSSVVLLNGVSTGAFSNTATINQQYYTVNESGSFIINSVFTNVTSDPLSIMLTARYEGSAAHEVELMFWNFTSGTWVDANATTKDFPSTTTDTGYHFQFPADSSPYRSGNIVKVAIVHTSVATGTHNMYIDYQAIILKTHTITNAGTFYVVNSVAAGRSKNATINATDGTITIARAGDYKVNGQVSITGLPGSTLHGHAFINGVEQPNIGFKRTINSNGDIGSASVTGIINTAIGNVIDFRLSSDTSGVGLAIEYLNFNIERILE